MIKRIKIYSNKSAKSLEIVDLLISKLIEKEFEIVEENPELAIAVGGDGTFLRMLKNSNFDSNIFYNFSTLNTNSRAILLRHTYNTMKNTSINPKPLNAATDSSSVSR
jgi:hypothetical protein